ncbi:MAG TPA: EpsI family protein [Terriglobales bacterium]|nr:EpsI family protein [Terriglobales bacterium]
MKAGVRYWIMVAVLLGATTGMAYLSHGEATPPAKPLSEFPVEVGPYAKVIDWKLDKETLDILKVTDYLNRGYWTPGMNQDLLGLYIGYFRSQRTGASIHSPKNCLPGAGWNPVQASVYQLPLDGGRTVPVNLYILRKALDEEMVLYWYQSHGRIIASEYWGKFYLVYDALRLNRTDAALVRITVPVDNGDEATAKRRAITFAKQVASDVDQIIPR